jgi:hypothetical protein
MANSTTVSSKGLHVASHGALQGFHASDGTILLLKMKNTRLLHDTQTHTLKTNSSC